MPKAGPTLFQNCSPEHVAVVMASSTGSRLFPVTSSELPKHMMPIGGIPVISRLLVAIEASGFLECVVLLSHDDSVSIPYLKKELLKDDENNNEGNSKKVVKSNDLSGNYQIVSSKPNIVLESVTNTMKITIMQLHDGCEGSVDAVRRVEEAGVVPTSSNMVVIPGDLVLFETSVLCNICDTHRKGFQNGRPDAYGQSVSLPTACTVLLADVGEQDEHGVPLKESAKQKKGGLGRDEEDIEYIALSYGSSVSSPSSSEPSPPRLILKQLKIDVHDNTSMTAETPKLSLPKPRLRVGGTTRVRTDWSDVHVYVLSPWVRRLLVERRSLMTIQGDMLPLLISRQFQGIAETFGGQVSTEKVQEIIRTSPDLSQVDLAGPIDAENFPTTRRASLLASRQSLSYQKATVENKEYAVLAHIQNEGVRTHTIASYLHANREILSQTCAAAADDTQGKVAQNACLRFPPNTFVRSKFHTILLPGASTGDKVTFKSVSVGRNCKLGTRCRLNNVVLMDNVTLGDNVILQNSIVGFGCQIGDNCNLNDCQIAPGTDIASGEKAKGESFS